MIAIFGCVLAIWFVLSISAQLSVSVLPRAIRLHKLLKPADPLGLIPRWTFFAPNPGIYDNHLLFRTGPTIDSLGDWREIEIICRPVFGSFIWNQRKRQRKAFTDNVFMLLRELDFCVRNKRAIAI